MKLAAYLLRLFRKPHAEQKLPQYNTILWEAVLKIQKEQKVCAYLYMHKK